MIDPGHEFSVPYEALIASLEDRLRHGVEQPDHTRFVFQTRVTAYELPRQATEVTRVGGIRAGAAFVFEAGVHYRFANNRLLWPDAANRPDDGTRIDVDYTWRDRPAGLTDFYPGSVAGTLVRAVARELKVLHEQVDQAYRRAFIDVATGVALDNVVALLGVDRIREIPARGWVTYRRRTATDRAVTIAAGSRVADPAGRAYRTLAAAAVPPSQEEFRTQTSGVVHTTDRIAALVGIWPRDDPALPATSLPTVDTAPNQAYGAGERTITLAPGTRPAGELRIRYRAKSVTVAVEAEQPGSAGNVAAGTVTVMPSPPSGIDGVINEEPIDGGRDPEPDDQLRERAKHALERAGNATLNALRFAVLGVDGVDAVEVLDQSLDRSIPLGEVHVRYSAAGDVAAIGRRVADRVEATRAAGIHAVCDPVRPVLVSGTFYLVPDGPVPDGAAGRFLGKVIAAIRALTIGQPLSVRRLNALAYQVAGLADVAEAKLVADGAAVTDPLVVGRAKLVRPDEGALRAVLLAGFRVDATHPDGNVDLRVVETGGVAADLTSYAIDVRVDVVANPARAPERISSFTRPVVFAGGATLRIGRDDVPGFHPGEHDSLVAVTFSAAAYLALTAAQATIELGG